MQLARIQRPPKFIVLGFIYGKTENYEEVFFEVYMPADLTEDLIIKINPSKGQRINVDDIWGGRATSVESSKGKFVRSISAGKIYPLSVGEDDDNFQGVIFCVAESVEIIEPASADLEQASISFWVTENEYLLPLEYIKDRFDQDGIFQKKVHREVYKIANKQFVFSRNFRAERDFQGRISMSGYLTAEVKCELKDINVAEVNGEYFDDLNEFLMLVSFASGERTQLVGWVAKNREKTVKYYHSSAFHSARSKKDFNRRTIHHSWFKMFLESAKQSIIERGGISQIVHALSATSGDDWTHPHENFLRLYSCLESLVGNYMEKNEGRKVLGSGRFSKLRKLLSGVISDFSGGEESEILLENISCLNSMCFRRQYQKFCGYYGLNNDDLWPLVEGQAALGQVGNIVYLKTIRNRLVHGNYWKYSEEATKALVVAERHLHCIVERAIIRFLGWDLEKSTVGKSFVHQIHLLGLNWQDAQMTLKRHL